MLPLQIPCSLDDAKLIINSCAPLPDQTQEKLKREPQSLGSVALGLCYWVGVNEKVQNTGEPMPSFFLGVDFIVFLAFFSSKFKPSPPPHPTHKGSAVCLTIELRVDSDIPHSVP